MAGKIEIRHLLNAQTGRIGWQELARHFARGVVVCVGGELDLVSVGEKFVANVEADIQGWFDSGVLYRAQDDDARRWAENDTEFWAVVVAPWVLVQENGGKHAE
jgi:hypothetical protein